MEFLPPGASVYLIGICGTGMASLAGLLKESGYHVSRIGQQRLPTDVHAARRSRHHGEDAVTPRATCTPRPDLVIIGNALSRGNAEVEETLDQGLRYESMASALKRLCLEGRRPIVVAGTHGKTTTTSMLSWIMEVASQGAVDDASQFRPGYLIGGKPENFASGFRSQPEPNGFFVIEGDEYDTAFFDKGPKFLHYLPRAVVLTSVEYDHADIYPDLDAVKTAFRRLVNLVPASGTIVAWGDSTVVEEVLTKAYCPVERYGLSKNCLWRAEKH